MTKVEAAKQPDRLTLVQWDGTNVAEVNEYIASVNDPTGTAYVVENPDGTAYVHSPMGDKPLVDGSLVHALAWQWGGPVITVYSPEEANAMLLPYPDYPKIVDVNVNLGLGL